MIDDNCSIEDENEDNANRDEKFYPPIGAVKFSWTNILNVANANQSEDKDERNRDKNPKSQLSNLPMI